MSQAPNRFVAFLHRGIGVVDAISHGAAHVAAAALLAACLISAGNALIRYAFSESSNAWLEIQWYLFAAGVMLGAPEVLLRNEHVRVDILWQRFSPATRRRINLAGYCLFLLPVMGLLAWMSWSFFWRSWQTGELSANAGGLVRWPVWLLLPAGFALLCLQAVAEALKQWFVPAQGNSLPDYERPLQ